MVDKTGMWTTEDFFWSGVGERDLWDPWPGRNPSGSNWATYPRGREQDSTGPLADTLIRNHSFRNNMSVIQYLKLWLVHSFGTPCFHIIALLVVPLSLLPLPSTLVETALWPACPKTWNPGVCSRWVNIQIFVWLCVSKSPFGFPNGTAGRPPLSASRV